MRESKLFARQERATHPVTHEMQFTMPFEVEVHELPQLCLSLSLDALFHWLSFSLSLECKAAAVTARIAMSEYASANFSPSAPSTWITFLCLPGSLVSFVSSSLSLLLRGETNLNYLLLVAQCICLNTRLPPLPPSLSLSMKQHLLLHSPFSNGSTRHTATATLMQSQSARIVAKIRKK